MSMRVNVEPGRRLAQTVMKVAAVDRWTEGDMASVSASRPLLLKVECQTFLKARATSQGRFQMAEWNASFDLLALGTPGLSTLERVTLKTSVGAVGVQTWLDTGGLNRTMADLSPSVVQ